MKLKCSFSFSQESARGSSPEPDESYSYPPNKINFKPAVHTLIPPRVFLRLDLPIFVRISHFLTRSTWLTHLILLDLLIPTKFGEEYKLWSTTVIDFTVGKSFPEKHEIK